MLEYGNPVEIVTKGALILSDLDILQEMAKRALVRVTVSLTSLDVPLSLAMEPRAAAPARRLEMIERLSEAGVPVRVNVAPIIPGLNDHELPQILKEAANRGAGFANYILLRLPGAVEELFTEWLHWAYPDRAHKVIHAIQDVRGGQMNDPRFGVRMRGEGVRADAISTMFAIHCRKLGLSTGQIELNIADFRRRGTAQQSLF
jgi:DNA repair photolyase